MLFVWQLGLKRITKNMNERCFSTTNRVYAEEALKKLKENNPYFEKYAEKIAHVQRTAPEKLLNLVENVPKEKKDITGRDYTKLFSSKTITTDTSKREQCQKLSDIMKIELMENKTVEEIKEIWFDYHKTKDVICAVISTEQYSILMEKGGKYPIFVFPLPRKDGYEFILLQFAGSSVHFTPLLCYQMYKENAPECLNLIHYPEFKDKGIILMRGKYNNEVLSGQEAQCLANQLQMYYSKSDESKLKLMESFTKHADKFNYKDLIHELENIKLS